MAKDQVAKPSNVGGKAKKKKWSKGKTKEKSNNSVIIDKETHAKMLKEVPTYKLITYAILVERLKINASAARRALIDLEQKGLIKKVSHSSKLCIYTRATAAAAAEEVKA